MNIKLKTGPTNAFLRSKNLKIGYIKQKNTDTVNLTDINIDLSEMVI